MHERSIELVIAGTKMEVFRRELLGKEKGRSSKVSRTCIQLHKVLNQPKLNIVLHNTETTYNDFSEWLHTWDSSPISAGCRQSYGTC